MVFEQDLGLLRRGGHEVHTYVRRNDEMNEADIRDRLVTAAGVIASRRTRRELSSVIRAFAPDIIHFHNVFPLISAAAYDVAYEIGVPIVQTVHNYRFVCASGTHFRQGAICEDCTPGHHWPAVLGRCYRGSSIGSLLVSQSISHQWSGGVFAKKITRFIALTEFAKRRLLLAGVDSDRINVCPNVIDEGLFDAALLSVEQRMPRIGEPYALFAGRFSEEKGLNTLLAAWRERMPLKLKILGSGPLLDECRSQIERERLNVEHLGTLPREQALSVIAGAEVLVVPSVWFEGMPMVILEAWAAGVPVIGSRIGGIEELLGRDRGLLFAPGDAQDLGRAVNALLSSPALAESIRRAARERVNSVHRSRLGLQRLEAVYRNASGAIH